MQNLEGSNDKIYSNLEFYQKLTNKQRDICDSETIRELDRADKIKSILLSGESGVGKTTQAILALRDYTINLHERNKEIFENDKNALYRHQPILIRYNDILTLLDKKRFGTDDQKTKAYYELEELKHVHFLVIDDFSSKKSGSKSDWIDNEIDKLFQDILEIRYGNCDKNITIITTNETKEEMQDTYNSWISKKTFSRLLACTKRYARSQKTEDLRNK
jgi:DNA replication protein DnaC